MNGISPELSTLLSDETGLEFAILVGSRADGSSGPESDWDIALQWSPEVPWLERLGRSEDLRHRIARILNTHQEDIDLIDVADANLTMRALIAEEGRPLAGDDSTAWARFLRRTWRELEDYYWERDHAA